ncbi:MULTISPECIES: hybrid sensor histidine kinase/response regulator [Thiorhodovibrio]|uniref:hybrid sensor histidine kinase/response regulator n=1 Tax=Thiorhodovibrio TaxID=61593 RepID=UPI001913026A|nr:MULTISPECIES: response regulator [Thiorhodovibrio]MBK5970714.1 hybrid sensor histidine kinase/response regulator [Thiorhodovibrio winogradskyi]WPL14259.1 Gliding motility regulatory protein [Thiorhodovibrio litoralis]
MAIDRSKFIGRFVEEARDHLVRLDRGLAEMAQGSAGEGITASEIDALFRSAHTIKGSARMLRLLPICDTAHAIEDLLGAFRSRQVQADAGLSALLQRGVDAIASAVDQLDRQPDPDALAPADAGLCAALSAAATPGDAPRPAAPAANQTSERAATQEAKAASAPASAPTPAPAAPPTSGLSDSDTLRVRLDHLDGLIRLMGEIIAQHDRLRLRPDEARRIARGAEAEIAPACEAFAHSLREDVQDQEVLIRELHDRALALRMLPLSILFEPAARNLRQLARSLGKEVRCTITGDAISLDRQLIDELADPLLHLLRNAVDHGLEPPDERQAAGKPASGSVRLEARRDGRWVEITIRDDGRGINVAAARDKAIRKGLLSAEQAGTASDSEIVDLIFTPGFSTSALITDISGRGVGMDVVKSIVLDRLQGSIQVDNRPGLGATFRLRLPLSLAIMRVLLIEAGGETLGFLAQHVAEILRLSRDSLLEVAERRAVIVRNEFVPVMPLAELLNPAFKVAPATATAAEASPQVLLVILRIGQEKLALEVDVLRDERDLVVKPVPEHLRHLHLVSGFVSSGALAVVSVLHAPAVLDLAARARGQSVSDGARTMATAGERVNRLLVVDDSLNTREIEKDVLQAHGYSVTLAEDGIDGLHKAMREQFDAVLTDVEMPRMDGFTLTERLRALDAYQATPIVIVTSREKEEDRQRGLRVGADAYIVKGDFDQSNLIGTLRALLG